ncbi:MAG: response regulator [Actinobacteria bacterium]|nr:response regulator [Actinomycetota bacterium]
MEKIANILIIDDEEAIRDSCSQVLIKENYNVETAGNGETGLNKLREIKADLALVDLKMPGLGGIEVLKKIRDIDPNIITIVITGFATIDSAVESMKEGAYDFLPKPFNPDELRFIVKRGLEKRKLALEAAALREEINRNLNEYKINLEKKIIERTEELEKANIRLEKEMIEYEKISHRLQEINNEKTKYLLFATHQLKAPFAAIQSYAEIILEGYTGEIPQRTHDTVLKIYERCQLLSKVIKEMLELEKLKSYDKTVTDLKKIDMCQVLSDVIKRFLVIAKTKDIKLVFNSSEDSCYIKGDKVQIDMLFSLLIENSIDYSPKNTEIQINLKEVEGSQVYIGIKDQGIGIPEKNLNNIFNEFFRSNNAADFHKNGSGLGLSIAKEIAKIHNTRIQVESELGKGSCFSIIFPLIT